MATFIIQEQVSYRIEADSAQEALDYFLNNGGDEIAVDDRKVFDGDWNEQEVEDD